MALGYRMEQDEIKYQENISKICLSVEQPPERNWESLCLSHSKLAWTRCWKRYTTQNNSATAIGLQWSNSSFTPLISVILQLIIIHSLWNLCSNHLLSLYLTSEIVYSLERTNLGSKIKPAVGLKLWFCRQKFVSRSKLCISTMGRSETQLLCFCIVLL